MSVSMLIVAILILGGVGGILNCAVTGEFVLPSFGTAKSDRRKKAWRPGWIGNVITGAGAAVFVGMVYGPLGQVVLNAPNQTIPQLTLAQLFGAVIVGMGGGNILTQLARRDAERVAKDKLADTLVAMLNPNALNPDDKGSGTE